MTLIIYLALIPVFAYLLVKYVQIERDEPSSRESKYNDSIAAAIFWPAFLFIFVAIIALMLIVILYGLIHLLMTFILKSLGISSLFYSLFDKIPQKYDDGKAPIVVNTRGEEDE